MPCDGGFEYFCCEPEPEPVSNWFQLKSLYWDIYPTINYYFSTLHLYLKPTTPVSAELEQ